MSAGSRTKDKEMASYMKQHPGRYPDSAMRPWNGEGAGYRALAKTMGSVSNNSSKWHVGMLGGVIAARLGLGSANVPGELINTAKRAA